jgi:hypothetical protein
MTLEQFLSSASSDNNLALQQAKEYHINNAQLVAATTVNQVLAQLNMTGVLQDIARTSKHPARHRVASVLLSVQGNHPFNFIEGTPAGDANLMMLDWLIHSAMTKYATPLRSFKQTMVSLSNKIVYPFEHTTLYDVLNTRKQLPLTRVDCVDGNVIFTVVNTTTQSVDKHSPRLFGLNRRLQQWQQITTIEIEAAGDYAIPLLPRWHNTILRLEDAYNIVERG